MRPSAGWSKTPGRNHSLTSGPPTIPAPGQGGAPAAGRHTQAQRRARLLGVIFLTRVLGFVSRLLLVPFFPVLMTQLQVGYTEVGLIFSAYLIGYGLALIPAGAAADHILPRPLLALGVGILAVALPATAYAANWYVAAGLRVIMGIATALIFSPVQKLVVAYFPPEARGQAFAWQEVAVSTGSLFSLTLAPLLGLWFSMAGIHWVAGILSGIAAALVLVIRMPEPVIQPALSVAGATPSQMAPGEKGSAQAEPPTSLWARWRQAGLLLLGAEFAVGSWVVSVIHSWLPTYLTEGAGWSAEEAALGMGLLLGLQMLAGVAAGRLLSRVRNRARLIGIASAVFAACSLVLAVGMRGPAFLLYPGVVLMGMVPPFTFVTLFAMSGDRLSPRIAGTGLGTLNTINQITTAVSSSFYGWLLDVAGSFSAIWGSAAALALVQVGLAAATKDSRR